MDNINTAEKKQYNIAVQPEVITELKRIQERLMKLVDGDEDLAGHIIEYSLLCGTGRAIFRNTVEGLVWEKYPDIRTDPMLERKSELFHIIYHFTNIIIGQHHLIRNYLKDNLPEEEWRDYKKQLRPLIEEEIISIFYPGDVEENVTKIGTCDIIADVTEQ